MPLIKTKYGSFNSPIAAPTTAPLLVFSPKELEEIRKCSKSPEYFIENYVKIKHQKYGIIPFKLYPRQKEALATIHTNQKTIVNKSRQIGMSTLISAYALWLIWFRPHKDVLVIATHKAIAKSIIQKVKLMISKLPPFIRRMATSDENNKFSLVLSNGSRIEAASKSPSAARSESLSLLILDEAAFIPNLNEIWAASMPTIAQSGGKVIVASSPNGSAGMFFDVCREAQLCPEKGKPGLNGFIYLELDWKVVTEHDDEWFKNETKNMPLRQIRQEYLCAFLGSGDTVLDSSTLIKIGEEIKDTNNKSFHDDTFPMIRIYKPYDEHKTYLLTGDTSRGDAEDYTGFHIWEITDSENMVEAAVFKDKIPYDMATDVAERLYNLYHAPVTAIESNYLGVVIMGELVKRGCDNIYYSTVREQIKTNNPNKPFEEQMKKVPGFTTSTKTRDMAISIWERMFREEKVKISSQITYDEFTTFQWRVTANQKKAEAQKGCHDDLVISSAIACYIFALEYDRILSNVDDLTAFYQSAIVERRNLNGAVIDNKENSNADAGTPVLIEEKYRGAFNTTRESNYNRRTRDGHKIMRDIETLFGGIFKG